MFWKLYLDDERCPSDSGWMIARSSEDAKKLVVDLGMPEKMSLDHDLGGADTTMVFLRWLYNFSYENKINNVPEYVVHSANPIGSKNIVSFMESWKKSMTIKE